MLEYPRSERTWGCWESSVIFYVFKKKNCCWSQKGNTILGIMFRYWNKVKTIIPRISKLFFVFLTVLFTEAEAPIFWPPNAKSWLIGKDSYAGKDWRQRDKEAAEDEMVRWNLWLKGHEYEQTSGRSLLILLHCEGEECHSPWGRRESDTT